MSTSRSPALAAAAVILAALAVPSCTLFSSRPATDRTTRLEIVVHETPEDVAAREYVWIDPQTGKVIDASKRPKAPPYIFYVKPTSQEEEKWLDALISRFELPISFDFVATPLDDVVAFLVNLKRTSIVVNRRAVQGRDNLTVTLRLEKVSFREALNAICEKLGLSYAIMNGKVYIGTKEHIGQFFPPYPANGLWVVPVRGRYEPSAAQHLRWTMDSAVSVDFANAPMDAVAALIRERIGIDLRLDPKAPDLPRTGLVTLKAEQMKFKDVLDAICAKLDMKRIVVDNVLVLSTKQTIKERTAARAALDDERTAEQMRAALNKPVSFKFNATPLKDAVAFLSSVDGANIIVDKRATKSRNDLEVTLELEDVKFIDGVEWIIRLLDLRIAARNGAIFISDKEGLLDHYLARTVLYNEKEWKPLMAAMDQPVSLDVVGVPVDKTLKLLSKQTGATIVLSNSAHRRADAGESTLHVEKMALKHALAWICYELDLAYTVKGGVIFITTPEAVRDKSSRRIGVAFARPRPIWPAEWDRERNRIPVGGPPRIWWSEAFEKRLAEPVSFDFIDTPIDDVVAFLINLGGVSVVVDKEAVEGR
ncbi:MAG: STN domain-containing protein, partial [Planctomycetota bacterium]